MSNLFFERPILNSPYAYPARHWELEDGQPTQQIVDARRKAAYLTAVPAPRKRRQAEQAELDLLAEGGLSDDKQKYDPIPIINELRFAVDQWRKLPSPNDWRVTPQTARLLQHWRHNKFEGVRPSFCQIEAEALSIHDGLLAAVLPDKRLR